MDFNLYRNPSANSSDVNAVDSAVYHIIIRGFNIINPNSYPVYLKFYNLATSSVTVGTTVPMSTMELPNNGSVYEPWEDTKICECFVYTTETSAYLTYAITKNLADNDATALASNVHVEFFYDLVQ